MKKHVFLSLAMAFIMLCTAFAINVPQASAADKNTYWIKVNTKQNVVTVYKKSGNDYIPIKAMVCSTGKSKSPTPLGTYRMKTKIGWCKLVGNVWGRYSIVIKGNYLFHSVPLKKKSRNSMQPKEYNKLGTNCSHGCVRLATMDAKWIWDKCPKGTKITIYRSNNPGPLGKPVPIKMKSSWKWDPTDYSKNNPNFKLKKPVITIDESKETVVYKGSSYSLTSKVSGYNPNAYEKLSSVKVHAVYKYNPTQKKYVKSSFSTNSLGKYKITYKLYNYYCGGTSYKNFYVNVIDKPEPTPQEPTSEEGVSTDDSQTQNIDTQETTID